MRRARRPTPALLAPALLLASALLLTGCGPADPPGPTASDAVAAELPAGVGVAIHQNRSDVAPRRLQISVTNAGNTPLEVTAARLAAPQFAAPADWPKDGATVRPGTTTDLPVPLPPADCSGTGPATVTLSFRSADGRVREATVEPDDVFDRLPALRAEDCLVHATAAVASMTLDSASRVTGAGGVRAVTVDLVVEPTGADGSFTVDTVTGTTLLAPADPATGARLQQTDVARRVDADAGRLVLPLTFVPNRCDAHAIAEDKRGTILPLHVTTENGTRGIVPVAADPALRSALLAFVAESCGLS